MKSACLPPHRSFAAARALFLAAVLCLFVVPARAVNFNDPVDLYNEIVVPNNPKTGDPNDPESRTCAQYVLESYALADANNRANGTPNAPVPAAILSNINYALTTLRALQNLKSGSTTYGNFAWSQHDVTTSGGVTTVNVNDQNAGEFVVQALAQVPLRFATLENQTASVVSSINTILTDAYAGIVNHNTAPNSVPSTYTNIAITRSWNLIVLGQVLTDSAKAQASYQSGRQFFDAWLNQTRATGINEFLSPTYYGSDMDSLGFLYLYSNDELIASKAQAALKLFWIDLYANWFTTDERMIGAHSRTYDFLKDAGSTDKYYYHAGLLTGTLPGRSAPKYWRGLDVTSYSVAIPADVPGLFTTFPRRVIRDFNRNNPTVPQFTSDYLVSNYAVGSTTTRYDDPTSESLTINLPGNPTASPAPTPPVAINFNTEGRGDPYLKNKVAGKTAVSKAIHLRPFVASVQRVAEVLFIASSNGLIHNSNPAKYDDSTDRIESSFVFPKEAEIWINNNATSNVLAKGASLYVAPGSTVFFRLNNVATGIRFLAATDVNGAPLGFNIVADGYSTDGKNTDWQASRITCVQAGPGTSPAVALPPASAPGREVIACWTRTASVTSQSAFDSFRSAFTTAQVYTNTLVTSGNHLNTGSATVSVAGLGSINLALTVNLFSETVSSIVGAEPALAPSLVNIGATPPTDPSVLLTINTVEYVTPTLQKWTGDDVGSAAAVGIAGTTSEDPNTGKITVTGAGTDIWNSSDSFHFCHQALQGDGYVIAQLLSFPTSGISDWAKAGIMMRESLTDPTSTNAYVCMTSGHGARFCKRTVTNTPETRTGNPAANRPIWFLMTRVGNTFTGYVSTDNGVTWAVEDAPVAISTMPSKITVGLALTSNNPNATATATFDNVGVFQGAYPGVLP